MPLPEDPRFVTDAPGVGGGGGFFRFRPRTFSRRPSRRGTARACRFRRPRYRSRRRTGRFSDNPLVPGVDVRILQSGIARFCQKKKKKNRKSSIPVFTQKTVKEIYFETRPVGKLIGDSSS